MSIPKMRQTEILTRLLFPLCMSIKRGIKLKKDFNQAFKRNKACVFNSLGVTYSAYSHASNSS